MSSLTSEQRDELRDELAHWPIGSGYYTSSVGTDEARDMADTLAPIIARWLGEAWERGHFYCAAESDGVRCANPYRG